MTIHKNGLGFTFILAAASEVRSTDDGTFPLVADVNIHFDDGVLAGLQLTGPAIIKRDDLATRPGEQLVEFIGGPLSTMTDYSQMEGLCETVLAAYTEFKELRAADPTAN